MDKVLYTILGAIGTVFLTFLLNLISDLITAERRLLLDRIRNWWAGQSDKRTKKRIEELEEKLETLSKYVADQRLLSLHFWQTTFLILFYFAGVIMGITSLFVSSEIPAPLIGILGALVSVVIALECARAVGLSRQIASYDLYKASIEQQIAELEEKIKGVLDISGTWKGSFHDEQSGELDIKQDGNNLQAVLTKDCPHLDMDVVYQEKLSGAIKGRRVILVGGSVSSIKQREISYHFDHRFDLTLSQDEKTLTGTMSDRDGIYGAEFRRPAIDTRSSSKSLDLPDSLNAEGD